MRRVVVDNTNITYEKLAGCMINGRSRMNLPPSPSLSKFLFLLEYYNCARALHLILQKVLLSFGLKECVTMPKRSKRNFEMRKYFFDNVYQGYEREIKILWQRFIPITAFMLAAWIACCTTFKTVVGLESGFVLFFYSSGC